ncbi:response regulator [Mucilaginibacter sp.]|uniref:response regulator n=1 Tax=Mucilaginibacter sp. TaxID=1882438 RepID=UPI003B009219
MPQPINVLIIDDSKEDCYLIEKRLKALNPEVKVFSFLGAKEAYNFIKDISLNKLDVAKNIIILDIYMPLMNGFEFVEEFENLPANVQECFTICALTSSISKNNMERIISYKSVKSFLEKPIKTESLLQLIES